MCGREGQSPAPNPELPPTGACSATEQQGTWGLGRKEMRSHPRLSIISKVRCGLRPSIGHPQATSQGPLHERLALGQVVQPQQV